jgi:c-di-GMP-binding flagellar brake protein YcgR
MATMLPKDEFEVLVDQLDALLYDRKHVARDMPRSVLNQMHELRTDLERRLLQLLRPAASVVEVERRQHVRVACDLVGHLRVPEQQPEPFQIIDVSVGGVRVQGACPFSLGAHIELTLFTEAGGNVELAGTIAWLAPNAFGVAFSEVRPATERTLFRLVMRIVRDQRGANS